VASGLLGWPAAELALHGGTLEVVMLDVGQGDALLLRSPRDRWILVDTGPRTPGFDAGARTVLPFLRRRGVRELALLLLTHPDMDHVGGAGAVLEGVPVRGVMDPGKVVGTEVFFHALEAAEAGGVPWHLARAGDSLNLDGVALRVLWPPEEGIEALDPNEASVVVEVRFGEFAVLLTGDAGTEAEAEFLSRLYSPTVQVLKAGHHGSATSTSPELLERTSPSLALVSVGRRNRYGHPHPSVLRRLENSGVRVLRTDLDGPVTIRGRKDGAFRVLRLTGD
jgi:competence protein ComEC